jgi:putative aldouronate transport system permease protein
MERDASAIRRIKVRPFSSDWFFTIVVYCFSAVILFITLYPVLFVLSASLSDPHMVNSGQVWLLPKGVNFEGYRRVFRNAEIWIGYRNTVFYTGFGTVLNLVVTLTAGFALSDRRLIGRGIITRLILFTMFFNGGLIPTYLLLRGMGMTDTIWSLLLPGLVGTTNLIICRTFFSTSIPEELKDAAAIDGCNTYQMFFRIVLPLSSAVIAVMALQYGIVHWNQYFNAMIYLKNRELYPLQLFLREILLTPQINIDRSPTAEEAESIAAQQRLAELIKYVVIIVSTLPVLLIYPFMQKYFVRGVMIGSIKG